MITVLFSCFMLVTINIMLTETSPSCEDHVIA